LLKSIFALGIDGYSARQFGLSADDNFLSTNACDTLLEALVPVHYIS